MNFWQKLNQTTQKNNSLLCVGLDTDVHKIPEHLRKQKDSIFSFNKEIIDHTVDLVCCYKPNIAFYEAYGLEGLTQLKKTIGYIHARYTGIPVILDAKRADIGNTANMYAKALYEYWNADATTVPPYFGLDTILPFLDYKDKCTILLIKTSNPDAKVFQDLKIVKKKKPFYLTVAEKIAKWNYPNIGLFVGATYPKELGIIRKLFPKSTILTAGIGAQGAKTQEAVKKGVDNTGCNLICNNSREIIYSGKGKDFAQKAREKAKQIRDILNQYR